jgi:hypothetical protein
MAAKSQQSSPIDHFGNYRYGNVSITRTGTTCTGTSTGNGTSTSTGTSSSTCRLIGNLAHLFGIIVEVAISGIISLNQAIM